MITPTYCFIGCEEDLEDLWENTKSVGESVKVRGMDTYEICDIILHVSKEADLSNRIKLPFANMRLKHIIHKVEFELNNCINLLRAEPTSRRARILEADYHPYNIACIQSVQFLIRQGKLEVKLFLRASDLQGVLPYDIYATRGLQDIVLKKLNEKTGTCRLVKLEKGDLTAFISSAHIYHDVIKE